MHTTLISAPELQALLADPGPALRPYVQMEPGTPQNDWSGLDGSLDWSACFLWEYGRPNDAVLARYAQTVSVAAVGDPFARVLYGPMIDEKYKTDANIIKGFTALG